jgi:hypothetical protein
MKKILVIVSFVLLFGAAQAWAQCRDIRIPRGRISTSVSGTTTPKFRCYRIRARDGQRITLHLTSRDQRVTFSMREDYYDADFTAYEVRDWEGETGNVDTYLISVGGGKNNTPFTLEVTIR